jgi:TrmH family RNA methyltransferase
MLYSSINNDKIKGLKKLNSKKYRDLSGLFLVDGEHLVCEAYRSGYLEELILLSNSDFSLDVPTSYVTFEVMKYISNLDTPSGIIGVCRKKESSLYGDRIVVLDDVQDPGNLGTIIRSCVAFNVSTLVLSEGCVDLYNSKVIRSTQGMIFKLNIIVVSDVVSYVECLKKLNFRVYSTKVNGGNSLKTIEKCLRFVIIMGNEGNGVREELIDLSDDYIYIDMNPLCESLNVGCATSIILYELDR